MVTGNILITNEGINPQNISLQRRNQSICETIDMLDVALKNGDKIFRSEGIIWNDFYCGLYGQNHNGFWDGVDDVFIEQFLTYSGLSPINKEIFNSMQTHRTLGGFDYEGHPKTDYIYNRKSWMAWHHSWYISHPGAINWTNTPNKIIPRYDETVNIFRRELESLKNQIIAGASICHNYDQKEKNGILKMNLSADSNEFVVNNFYKYIMSHKSGTQEIISYAKTIGSEICELNFYHREEELEKKEKAIGNKSVSIIYSIVNLDGNYQYLSIDTRHGMFELCDSNGTHLRELRFDGSDNTHVGETDHSLKCIDIQKQVQ